LIGTVRTFARASRKFRICSGAGGEKQGFVCDDPARQIAINAGEDGSVVVGKIQDNDTYAFGFDAQTGKFENLVSHGIMSSPETRRACPI
jgi:hypothetical protein